MSSLSQMPGRLLWSVRYKDTPHTPVLPHGATSGNQRIVRLWLRRMTTNGGVRSPNDSGSEVLRMDPLSGPT